MRTNINFAKNFHKHYPNHNKNMWAESLTKGDLILVNGKPVVYLSHVTRQVPNGMGGYTTCTKYEVITGLSIDILSDISNTIEPLQ